MFLNKTTLNRIIFLHFLFSISLGQAQFYNTQQEIIDVVKYQFHLKLNDATNSITANAKEAILLKKQVDSIFLHLKNLNGDGKGMQVSSVKNQFGKDLDFKHKNDHLTIFNPGDWIANDVLKLEIQYAGIPEDGLYISQNMYDNKTFFGDNWPNRAQYWLPVIDHPSDKAMLDFYITAPSHYEVVASGELISKKSISDNLKLFQFKTTNALPSKVMVIAAADFKIKALDSIKGIPVSSWIFEDNTELAFDDYMPAVEVVKFYDSLIAPFPYKKLANVQSKTRFGGMENAGNIFYYEASANGKKQVEALVAHEVAHQWFGDSVTEKEWRDIWLSEGFATYLTDVYLEFKYGKKKLQERMKMEREKVVRYAAYKGVKPIVYDEEDNLFKLLNRNSYEKGAWVLHMLRNKIGDKNFFTSLRNFYIKYQHQNADTNDFISIVENVSKMDLTVFFNQWLFRTSIPSIQLDWKIENEVLVFDLQQFHDIYEFELPITISDQNKTYNFSFEINSEDNHFEFPVVLNAEETELVIDPEVVLLFKEE